MIIAWFQEMLAGVAKSLKIALKSSFIGDRNQDLSLSPWAQRVPAFLKED
jgi:hypothetical protein